MNAHTRTRVIAYVVLPALTGTLAKENRAWFDYMRRTVGDRVNEPPDTTANPDPPEQYEQ